MKKTKLVALLMALVMVLSVSAASAETYNPFWIEPMETPVTLNVVTGWGPDASLPEGTTPENNKLLSVLEDMNIKLNYLWTVPDEQFDERLALQISSGELPDVVMLGSSDYYDFRDTGYLRDLTEAYEKWGSDELKELMNGMGADALKYGSKDGKIYGIPAVLDAAEGVVGLYYRADWLKALNMEVPTTMDGVNEMIIALAKYGETVNGGKTVAGMANASAVLNNNFSMNGYFQAYGSYPNRWVMRDGKLMNGLLLDETLDALKGLHYLYENGGIAVDFPTWNFDTFEARLVSDQVATVFGTYYIAAWPLNENKQANPDADWAEIDLINLGSKPAMNQASLQFFNVVTKDAPAGAEEALIKMLNMSLASSANSTSDKTFFNGRDLAKNGSTVFWLPAYMYYPTPYTRVREHVYAAYDAKDEGLLTTDYERELYGYMTSWLSEGTKNENFATNWGQYMSRLGKEMGIALGLRARETGNYEPNYFYGPTTEAESRYSSTLSDMASQFVNDFIMGNKTEADWATFKTQYLEAGGQAVQDAINAQYAEITK